MAPTICHKAIRMDLKQIKGVGPAKQDKLKAAGITSVEQLARCDVAQAAHKAGLPESQVRELKHRAAALSLLEDLKAVGPGTLGTLSSEGARSVRELYAASGDWLAAEIKVAQAKLAELRAEAEAVARHVAQEARTPEGRARLAEEGLAVAQATARKAQAAGRKALAAAEKQRDLAVARAKELQQQAPIVVEQAQARVREVESALRQAVQRSEQAVRAEAQKAKARTERVVAQARARMDRKAVE